MQDFQNAIWQKYLETSLRLKTLERRYFFVMIIISILVVTYAQLYYWHFKNLA